MNSADVRPAASLDDRPLIITVAPTGAEVTRRDNPALPYTPAEIAAEVLSAAEAGASIAHLHVREPDGEPSARPELFVEAVTLIRESSDIVVGVSTGGSVGMTLEQRKAGLSAAPDLASLETGSTNFGEELFATLPAETRDIAAEARERSIGTVVEAFELGHIDAGVRMWREAAIPAPVMFDLVLGVAGAVAATPERLVAMASAVPDGVPWGATVVGRHQRRLLGLAMLLGADVVRVGFEDNVYLRRGRLATSNAELVADIAALATSLGRTVASAGDARELLSVQQGDIDGHYG